MSFSEAEDAGTQNDRREVARAKARELRDIHRKQARRNRLFLRGGIGLGIIVILGVIALILVTSITPVAAGPLNMRSDGLVIGKDLKVVHTGSTPANADPIPTVRDKKSTVVSIRIYVDFFCPTCKSFVVDNKAQLTSWMKNGAVTLEIHPVAFLDRSSLGTEYSTRSANAAACVANYAPSDFWAFTEEMYDSQPAAGTGGLSDAQIATVMRTAKVHRLPVVTACEKKLKFKSWVDAATTRAINGPLPDSTVKTVTVPPTIIVDGVEYPVTADGTSAAAFAAFVEQTAGSQFTSGEPTPTPTPTPTPAS